MRIVFMGTPASAAASLETLLRGPDEVVGVVTQPDRPAGRGQATTPSPVRRRAEEAGIPVLTPRKMKDPGLLERLRGWRPHLVVVVAYGRILPQAILDLPPLGCINVHYSLLPRYRGAAPMQWAILQGEAVTGVTTMQLVAEMDAGPVLLAEEVAMAPDETAASLEAKLVPVGARLLTATVAGVGQGSLTPRPQDPSAVTFAPMLSKDDGMIDWTRPAQEIERRIRAFTPWPSAFTYRQGKRIKVHGARPAPVDRAQCADAPGTATSAAGSSADPARPAAAPGTVVRAGAAGISVATGAGVLLLTELQMEGRKRLPAEAFLRGAGIQAGARFEGPSS